MKDAPSRSYSGATGHRGSRNSPKKFREMAGIQWLSLILLEAPRCWPCWRRHTSLERCYISELQEGAEI